MGPGAGAKLVELLLVRCFVQQKAPIVKEDGRLVIHLAV